MRIAGTEDHEPLVPRSIVVGATIDETAYSNPAASLRELLRIAQDRDELARRVKDA